tara:strand:+ start:9299 stop:10234 length:936 start_codon:yes stop_codon:yes gene_type:complete
MTKEIDFFLVGAMKAGTTTLFDSLLKHSKIYMPIEKEPFYYVWSTLEKDLFLPANNKKLVSHKRWKIFDTKNKYQKLFDDCLEDQLCGEASTFYLPHERAAAAIKSENPNAKILIVLRNPVERAYSAYNFQVSFSLEPAVSFEAALDQELKGLRDNWLYGWRHIYCGLYYEQVKRYMDLFGEENVLVETQDDLRSNRQEVLDRCFDFLGVEKIAVTETKNSNITFVPTGRIGKFLHFAFSRPNLIKDSVKGLLPLKYRRLIKNKVMASLAKNGKKPERMNPKTRQWLIDIFYEDILSLERLLNRDLSSWYK